MSVVAKYLTKPQLQSGKIGFIYRGQSNADWGLTSTYYRRFNFSKSNDKSHNPTQKQFQDYHKDLISDAKSYHYHKKELNDLELLLELQHYGAATGFVDFSRDFLIALWFASHGSQNTGGKVFLLDTNSIDKFSELQEGEEIFAKCDKLQFVNNNFKSNNRIFSQKGVFVFGNQTIDDVKTIEILQKDKQLVLQELSDIFSIDEKSLFQDIHGFSMVNDANHPIYEKTAEEYTEKGNNNYHKSEFEKAIEAYKKAIKIDPDSDGAHHNIGLAYDNLGKFEKAIEAYKKAIKINPNNDGAYFGMGLAYYNLDKFEEAIEAHKKAIEINPNGGLVAYHYMGLAYYMLNKFKEAIEAYKKSIEINPNSAMAYHYMGLAYYMLNKFKEAIDAYKKAIDLNPALIIHDKQQNWHPLETWINNLTDNDKKQQYLHTLKRLKNG
jgi:tetratricopeptide (TPR) repeat protein